MMHKEHLPVLLSETLAALDPRPGQTVVDCTVGLGGHASALLHWLGPEGRLVGLDFDAANLEVARERLAAVGGRFDLRQTNFAGLPAVLAELGIERVDGILADLGVSSPQIDDAERGFSYRRPGPLDMRMDPARGKPAWELLQRIDEMELAEALRELGDEEDAAMIARLIVERRADSPIRTTQELTAIVCAARNFTLERAAGAKLHPAARTFQAVRMLVNRETGNLERLLAVLPDCLKSGGIAAVLSFHSGEDRRVKHAFRDGRATGVYAAISEEAILASEGERRENSRARSAKLRWARRV